MWGVAKRTPGLQRAENIRRGRHTPYTAAQLTEPPASGLPLLLQALLLDVTDAATDAADLLDAAELGLPTDFAVAADFAVTADLPVLPDFILVISLTEPPIASNSDSTSASATASSFFRSLSISWQASRKRGERR